MKDSERFEFTRSWFMSRNKGTFSRFVLPHWSKVDRPIVYLEIGVFEGQSLAWVLQNVLTHPASRAIGIDPWLMTSKQDQAFMDAVRLRAINNLFQWTLKNAEGSEHKRCTLFRANSDEILNCMLRREGHCGVSRGTLDLCMIDGDHYALPTWNDARLCLQLLRIGGWMLFDDVENTRPKWDHVSDGVARFVEEAGDQISEVWRHRHMVCFERVR